MSGCAGDCQPSRLGSAPSPALRRPATSATLVTTGGLTHCWPSRCQPRRRRRRRPPMSAERATQAIREHVPPGLIVDLGASDDALGTLLAPDGRPYVGLCDES